MKTGSFLLFLICGGSLAWAADPVATPMVPPPTVAHDVPFLTAFPHLKDYTYEEPLSGFYLGGGFSPIGAIGSSMMFTGDFFELHWIKDRWDVELLDASVGITRAQSSEFQATYFTFRASPKYRFYGIFSAGPLFGYELVSFPNVGAKILRGAYEQPESEPFSSRGWIYGAEVSENFQFNSKSLIKVSELVYKETYSATTTAQGWSYYYDDATVRQDVTKVGPGTVFMLQVSFLY